MQKPFESKDFGFLQGRMRRRTYWLYNLALLAVLFPVAFLFSGVLKHSGFVGTMAIITVALVVTVLGATWSVKRYHDMGDSGWWVLGHLVPLLNFFLSIKLLFVSGDQGPNRYGPDPRQQEVEPENLP